MIPFLGNSLHHLGIPLSWTGLGTKIIQPKELRKFMQARVGTNRTGRMSMCEVTLRIWLVAEATSVAQCLISWQSLKTFWIE